MTNFAAVPTSIEFWDDIKGTSQKAKSLVHCGIECYQQKKKFENCVALRFVDGVCEMATSYPTILPQSSSSIKVYKQIVPKSLGMLSLLLTILQSESNLALQL